MRAEVNPRRLGNWAHSQIDQHLNELDNELDPIMQTFDDLFPSKFLKATDIQKAGGTVTVTIAGLRVEEFDERDGTKKKKPILQLHGTEKELMLNVTNGKRIAHLHGTELAAWTGKPLTLLVEPVDSPNGVVDAIRVSPQPPNAAGAVQPQAAQPPTAPPPPAAPAPTPSMDPGGDPQPAAVHANSSGQDDLPF